MPGLMEGKVAVVTGAGGGVGREIAIMMAKAGARVIVADIGASLSGEGGSTTPAEQTKALINQQGGLAEICAEFGRHLGLGPQDRTGRPGSLWSYRCGGEQRRHPA